MIKIVYELRDHPFCIFDLNGSLIKLVTKTVAVKVYPYGINNWYYMDFDLSNDIDNQKYTY